MQLWRHITKRLTLPHSFSRRRSRALWRREFRTCWWNITSSAGTSMAKKKNHTHPVSCKHRPNHSPSAEKQGSHVKFMFISCTALCHMAEMVSVCESWHNSFTFCDSFKSLSVQRRSPLPRVHIESNYRKGQCGLCTSSPPKQNKYCTIWGTVMVVMTHKWILAPEGLFWRAKLVSEWSRFTFVCIGNVKSEIKPHLAKQIFIITFAMSNDLQRIVKSRTMVSKITLVTTTHL